jgi:nephrocystin-3
MTTLSRLVRIFISSTFRDFMAERDELVKKVFPELRRRCKDRFVEIVEVDLRWGITEDQSRAGATLKICLQEIDRCRPSAPVFFIGLLGERYGWVPPVDYYPVEVLEDPELAWVREHIGGKSVTELEILHGVLNNRNLRDHAFFYFRQDGYQIRHWARIHQDYPDLVLEDFTNERESDPESARGKQDSLKERVRRAGLRHSPQLYEEPSELARIVLEDLWLQIESVFPASEVPDELERERLDHEAFAKSRLKGYVRRPHLLEALDEVLDQGDPSIKIVTGSSGGGKSALLAFWMDQRSDRIPPCTFVHYIGGTPESGTLPNLVFRLMRTIQRWGSVHDRVPDDLSEAVAALPHWLARTAEVQGEVLIVLDALNQLEEQSAHDLSWLPAEPLPGVRWVVSTLPGRCEDALMARGWATSRHTVEVPPLERGERASIVESYLGLFTKRLDKRLAERLAAAPQSENALFLKVALDELRIRGRHEALEELIDRILACPGPVELFVLVLKNLEEFDKDRPNLVRESLGFLGAARRGLSETELLQLLSDHEDPATRPLPRALWSPVFLSLEGSLVERNGRLSFFHDFLREAVAREYLDEEWERRRVHSRFTTLASRLLNGKSAGASLDHYLARYAGHHAGALGDLKELAGFAVSFSPSRFEMLSLSEGISLVSEACAALQIAQSFEDDPGFLSDVASLLETVRAPETARPVCRKLIRSGDGWRKAFRGPGLDGRGATYVFASEWAAWIQELPPEEAEREIDFIIESMNDIDGGLGQAAIYAFKYAILADPDRFTTSLLEQVFSGWQENRLMLTTLVMQLAIDGLHLPVVDEFERFWSVTWEYNAVELGLLKGALEFRSLPSPHADEQEAAFFRQLEQRRSSFETSPDCFASRRILDRFWSLGQSGDSLEDDLRTCLREQQGQEILELLLEFPFWEVAEKAAEVLSEKMAHCNATRDRVRALAHAVDGDAAYAGFVAFSLWAFRAGEVGEYLLLVDACSLSSNCQVRGQAAESLMSFLRDCGDGSLGGYFSKALPSLRRFLHDSDIWPVQETLHNLQALDDRLATVGVDWRALLKPGEAPIISLVAEWEVIGPDWMAFEEVARSRKIHPPIPERSE